MLRLEEDGFFYARGVKLACSIRPKGSEAMQFYISCLAVEGLKHVQARSSKSIWGADQTHAGRQLVRISSLQVSFGFGQVCECGKQASRLRSNTRAVLI